LTGLTRFSYTLYTCLPACLPAGRQVLHILPARFRIPEFGNSPKAKPTRLPRLRESNGGQVAGRSIPGPDLGKGVR